MESKATLPDLFGPLVDHQVSAHYTVPLDVSWKRWKLLCARHVLMTSHQHDMLQEEHIISDFTYPTCVALSTSG